MYWQKGYWLSGCVAPAVASGRAASLAECRGSASSQCPCLRPNRSTRERQRLHHEAEEDFGLGGREAVEDESILASVAALSAYVAAVGVGLVALCREALAVAPAPSFCIGWVPAIVTLRDSVVEAQQD